MKTPENTLTTSRRALLGAAVAASSAAALPAMASAGNAAVSPAEACPALALYREYERCLAVVRGNKGLGDEAPEWDALDRSEEAFMRAEARSAEGVYLKLWHYWDRGGPLDQFNPSGFTWDDRVRFSVLRDLAKLGGLPPLRIVRPRRRRKEADDAAA
jgi:hypothetical protein